MSGWTSGNRLELIENGEAFFPRVFEAIAAARREVVLETFAWFEDEVGHALRQVLLQAAERNVDVQVIVDGFGSHSFSPEFLEGLAAAGVRVHSYDPRPTLLRVRTNVLCRLHRKIVVIDGELAFVGGINFTEEHLRSFGSRSKQDYAVEVHGPVVRDIHAYCRFGTDVHAGSPWRRWRYWLRRFPREMTDPRGDAQALFVIRDNDAHPTDIETMYRAGIRNARDSIIIANAYFFPGYRFIRDLADAAERGVDVRLIVQGSPERPASLRAASILFDDLLAAGIRILQYEERPLHAKVAVIDEKWATVGSSNLDPVSLGLNLEANLFALDRRLNAALRRSLDDLLARSCRELALDERPARSLARRLLATVAYHVTRHMHAWGRRVPYRAQHVRPMRPPGRPRGEAD